jgi:hypothetical protein
MPFDQGRNSEGVASWFDIRKTIATPSELRQKTNVPQSQGFKANPGLEFANAFSVSGLVIKVEQALSRLLART